MATWIPDLSEDTIFDILSRLPVKSLLRFRTVSKSWLSIISHPQFIQSQYHIAGRKKGSILVNQILHVIPKDYDYIFIPYLLSSYYRIIGSCKGIVCLADPMAYLICLWNPSIKQYKRIPSPHKYPLLYRAGTLAFGYDSISNDYKLLCLGPIDTGVELVEVFSTNAGCWSQIRRQPPRSLHCYNHCLALNGVLYFQSSMDRDSEIIWFDLHKEVFGVVMHPFYIQKMSNIFDFEGSVAIVCHGRAYQKRFQDYDDESLYQEVVPSTPEDADRYRQEFALWTMENNDGTMCWIKKFAFDDNFKIDWVNLYLGDGHFYGRNYLEEGSYSPGYSIVSHICYDHKKKECKYFQLQDCEFPEILKYTESLVRIKGFESTGWQSQKQSRQQRSKSLHKHDEHKNLNQSRQQRNKRRRSHDHHKDRNSDNI